MRKNCDEIRREGALGAVIKSTKPAAGTPTTGLWHKTGNMVRTEVCGMKSEECKGSTNPQSHAARLLRIVQFQIRQVHFSFFHRGIVVGDLVPIADCRGDRTSRRACSISRWHLMHSVLNGSAFNRATGILQSHKLRTNRTCLVSSRFKARSICCSSRDSISASCEASSSPLLSNAASALSPAAEDCFVVPRSSSSMPSRLRSSYRRAIRIYAIAIMRHVVPWYTTSRLPHLRFGCPLRSRIIGWLRVSSNLPEKSDTPASNIGANRSEIQVFGPFLMDGS